MKVKKFLKISGAVILLSFTVLYLAFLFVLPNIVDLNKYADKIQGLVQKNTDFGVVTSGIKIKTNWNFDIGVLVDKTDLFDSRGKKFSQINDLKVDISVLSLIFKKIRISKISAEKFLVNLETDDKGEFLLQKYFEKNNDSQELPYNLKLSNSMPDVFIKQYRVSILNKKNNYSIKGQNLKVSDFVLSKKIKVSSNGDIVLNDRKQISYNFSIFSKLFAEQENKQNEQQNLIKILDDLYKYNVKAKVFADLYINEKGTEGKVDIDKISFVIENLVYPHSSVKLAFKGEKVHINSSLHIDKKSKAIVTGIFKSGKNKHINLNVASDDIQIKDILLIAQSMSNTLGLEDIRDIDAKGLLKAKFKIKSNFKKVESDGYLKIKDASLRHKLHKILVSDINADIDFSKDKIKIKKADAKVNSQPVKIKGSIDQKAFVNISVTADNLPLKGTLLSLGQTNILKENNIYSGLISVNAVIKGRLDKVVPKINASVKNVSLKNIKANTQIKLANVSVNAEKETADIKLSDLKIYPQKDVLLSIPQSNAALTKDKLTILDTKLYLNNIEAHLSGNITGISSKPVMNSLNLKIPVSKPVSLKGYASSKVLINGDLVLTGDLYNPQIKGSIKIPLLSVPSYSVFIKNANLEFENGKITAEKFKIETIVADNIKSDFKLNNNVLYLNNLSAWAYNGKVAGDISYNILKNQLNLNLQGRGLSANAAIQGLTGRDENINGVLDFDTNISMKAGTQREILKSLQGDLGFIVNNGKMGLLGKFEYLLYAQNILSNSFFKATLNVVAKAIMVKNTGVYKYMKGKMSFSNGWANIDWIKTSGPSMSLYIKGRYYLPDNKASLTMLGRISDDVVKILGPIGEFSMDKVISCIPKLGEITALFVNQYTTNPNYENISEIPPLTPKTSFETKEFKVIIDGDVHKQSSVKSFKWISNPKIECPVTTNPPQKLEPELPDFVKKLPNY